MSTWASVREATCSPSEAPDTFVLQCLSDPLVQFFRLDLCGEWAAFIEVSKRLAELVIGGKLDGEEFGTDEDAERLKSLRKPFLSLLAKAQEES